MNTVNFVTDLNARIQHEIGYIVRLETGVFEPDETLQRAQGSCRDSSWLLVQALRHLGFAARFVSGYLIQLKPDLVSLDGPAGTDHDFTDLHAWCEVYLPGAGWIGLDPTSGLLTGESHMPLAATPHYRNAAPISGFASFAKVEFDFDMTVSRVAEHPRITKPFSDESWDRLNALGRKVDDELIKQRRPPHHGRRADLRLDRRFRGRRVERRRRRPDQARQGRRPDPPPARALRARRLAALWPGQMVPRRDPAALDLLALLAPRRQAGVARREAVRPRGRRRPRPSPATTSGCSTRSPTTSALGGDTIDPAYEDPGDWLVKEARLPPNVDPANSELADPEARPAWPRCSTTASTTPTGYVLPVQRWNALPDKSHWITEKWKTRRGKLFLAAGDSPVGYRLPLSSLKHVEPTAYPHVVPRDPLVAVGRPA